MTRLRCRLLAEKINAYFSEEMAADATVVDYLITTVSDPTLEKVIQIIEDPSNSERDSIVDLLLFPDENLQLELEHFLSKERFSRSEKREVIQKLADAEPRWPIKLPQLNGTVEVRPSAMEIGQLITRLHITWEAAEPILWAIDQYLSPHNQLKAMVRLRNLRPSFNTAAILLICRFLKVFNDSEATFFNYFDYMVGLLGRMVGDDPYEELVYDKQRMVAGLKQAVRFNHQLARNNMETLMLKGIRAPAESIDYFQKNIAIIDAIVSVLYRHQYTKDTDWPPFFFETIEKLPR